MNLDLADRLIAVAERLLEAGELTQDGWKTLLTEIEVARQ